MDAATHAWSLTALASGMAAAALRPLQKDGPLQLAAIALCAFAIARLTALSPGAG